MKSIAGIASRILLHVQRKQQLQLQHHHRMTVALWQQQPQPSGQFIRSGARCFGQQQSTTTTETAAASAASMVEGELGRLRQYNYRDHSLEKTAIAAASSVIVVVVAAAVVLSAAHSLGFPSFSSIGVCTQNSKAPNNYHHHHRNQKIPLSQRPVAI